jgi:Ca2+-binding EF-hand superfamily protein
MSIFDTDRSGSIGFNEFAGLWKYIKDWQGVFRHFDKDRSGSIDGAELQAALKQFGYNLSPTMLQLVEKKYGMLLLCSIKSTGTDHVFPWGRYV